MGIPVLIFNFQAIGKLEYERIQAERAKVVVEKEDDVDKYEKQYKVRRFLI